MRPIGWAWMRLALGICQIIGATVTVIWVGQTGFTLGPMASFAATSACTGLSIALFRILRLHERTTVSHPSMKKYTSEFIGTFGLVFAGTGAIVVDDVSHGSVTHLGVALTFGLIVLAMIYALGEVSGAHLNPAVTLGFVGAGRMPVREAPPYVASQCAGAVAASGVLRLLFPTQTTLGGTAPAGSAGQSLALETILTAILMFVILRVSAGSKEKGITAGIAVGAVVGLEALFAGPICGASMNPARSLGPALVSGQMASLWIYVVGPAVGALVAVPAALLFRNTETS